MAYAPPRNRTKSKPSRAKSGPPSSPRRSPTAAALSNCSPAAALRGSSEAIMVAHDFTVEQMFELFRAGLAAAVPGEVKAGGHTVEVNELRITEEGQRC